MYAAPESILGLTEEAITDLDMLQMLHVLSLEGIEVRTVHGRSKYLLNYLMNEGLASRPLEGTKAMKKLEIFLGPPTATITKDGKRMLGSWYRTKHDDTYKTLTDNILKGKYRNHTYCCFSRGVPAANRLVLETLSPLIYTSAQLDIPVQQLLNTQTQR